jgi:hypothetical protein
MQNGSKRGARSFPLKRLPASGHFIEHHPKREQVGASIQGLARDLLRRHVCHRPHHAAPSRQVLRHGGIVGAGRVCSPRLAGAHFRHSEIENLGVAALGDEDVGGLYIAMDDVLGVGCVERIGDFNAERKQGVNLQGAPADAMFQGQAVQKLHDDEPPSLVAGNLMNSADIGMIQGGGCPGFAPETLQGMGIVRHFVG